MMEKKLFFSLFLSIYTLFVYGWQQDPLQFQSPDSLLQKSYDELETKYNAFRNDSVKSAPYARAYLKKSIWDKDILKQADAYHFLALISTPVVSEKYGDSIIFITKDLNNYTYLTDGILIKARALQAMGAYKEAMDQFLKAYNYAIANDNFSQQLYINNQIGILRNDLEEYKEALIIFRDYAQKMEQKAREDNRHINNYKNALFNLADSYNRNRKYDSAIITSKKGIAFSLKNKGGITPMYYNLIIGLSEYHKKNYDTSLTYISTVSDTLRTKRDKGNLMICYLYMGKIYENQGRSDAALLYYKKIDSIAKTTSTVPKEIREGYESLISYYKKRQDTKNQLKYIERLLQIDSLLKINYKHLSKNIYKKYDTRQLVIEKDNLVENIKDSKATFRISIISLSSLLLLISVFTFYYYYKQRLYRKRFEILLHEKNQEKKNTPVKVNSETLKDLNISETALNKITESLKAFVHNKQFLRNDVSLNNLASMMNTNPKYLSGVIKQYQQKNFIDYVTDLRINYIVEELKTNTTFRKYSIRAIAEEAGFNTSKSFSRAFYKRTGIYPSYYIKKLEE